MCQTTLLTLAEATLDPVIVVSLECGREREEGNSLLKNDVVVRMTWYAAALAVRG